MYFHNHLHRHTCAPEEISEKQKYDMLLCHDFYRQKKKEVNSLFRVFHYTKDFTNNDTQENLPRGSQYLE